jgi:hypothetical protein
LEESKEAASEMDLEWETLGFSIGESVGAGTESTATIDLDSRERLFAVFLRFEGVPGNSGFSAVELIGFSLIL